MPKPVKYYVTGSGTHLGTMDRIENRKEWAILHDTVDKRWEVWIDGELMDTDFSEQAALAMMQRYLDDPWWDYRRSDGSVTIPARWRD